MADLVVQDAHLDHTDPSPMEAGSRPLVDGRARLGKAHPRGHVKLVLVNVAVGEQVCVRVGRHTSAAVVACRSKAVGGPAAERGLVACGLALPVAAHILVASQTCRLEAVQDTSPDAPCNPSSEARPQALRVLASHRRGRDAPPFQAVDACNLDPLGAAARLLVARACMLPVAAAGPFPEVRWGTQVWS